MGVAVRPRRAEDLPALLFVLQQHHGREGYPVRPEAVTGEWLASGDELAGLVAVDGERVVGHAALHPADARTWSAVGDVGDLAVVSRLFTDRTVPGAGTVLLASTVERAHRLGRSAVLQVDPDSAARGWYARRGWRELGTCRQQWGPRTVDAVLLAEPV